MSADSRAQTNLLMEKKRRINKCVECGGNDLILDVEHGELVCENCGYVNSSSLLDYGPEWRAFDAEQIQRKTRVGAPLNIAMHDKGLSTIIGWRDRDAYGRRLNPEQRAKVYRLRKWHRRSRVSGSVQKNLTYALSELTKFSYKLNLPRNVVETASMLYRRIVRKRLIRGRSMQGVTAASIYMACRQCNVLRSLEEVSKAANITKKEGGRNYRFLLKKLKTDVPRVDPQRYVSRLINHLSLSGGTEIIATNILDLAHKLRLTSGRGPAGMAAGATYMATVLTNERRTQSEIAKAAKVTEVTIRNRYKELTQKLSIKVDI